MAGLGRVEQARQNYPAAIDHLSLGLPPKMFLESLIAFNAGVKRRQASVILLAWALVGRR